MHVRVCLCVRLCARVRVRVCSGGTSRASGMILHYKPMGSQDSQQLHLEAAEDKKVASLWLAAMHKVDT